MRSSQSAAARRCTRGIALHGQTPPAAPPRLRVPITALCPHEHPPSKPCAWPKGNALQMNNRKPALLDAQTELHRAPKLAASMPALHPGLSHHRWRSTAPLSYSSFTLPSLQHRQLPGCALPHHAVTWQRIPQIKAFTFPTVREQGDRGQQYRHPALFPLLPSTKPLPNSSRPPPPHFNTNAAKLQNNTPLQVKHEMKTQMASQSKHKYCKLCFCHCKKKIKKKSEHNKNEHKR